MALNGLVTLRVPGGGGWVLGRKLLEELQEVLPPAVPGLSEEAAAFSSVA